MHKRKKLVDLIIDCLEEIKGFILAAVVIIAVLGAVVGYRYYRYTQDEPHYCSSCHLMKEAFVEWEKGKHRDIVCQTCHYLNILEQNQLLITYVVKGDNKQISQTHGREKPWKECKKCHIDEASQGSLTLRKSYGHAKHVFMERIGCDKCHTRNMHNFKPNEDACETCHSDKGVHGVAFCLKVVSCLKCHSFSENTPAMIPKGRCIKCHSNVPSKGSMSSLLCHQCHKPHGKAGYTSDTCISECHRNEATVGQHDLHMGKGLKCLDCHKPHSWVVGQQMAKTLCIRCHSFKDPRLFIY
ncbi:MAG: hypothetical protein HY755_05445 [Nitrospirae bacterium]|nr:hypothetical protein [Nitrospirota bacterium]